MGGGALGEHEAQYTNFTNEKTVGCWTPTVLLSQSALLSAKWVFGKEKGSHLLHKRSSQRLSQLGVGATLRSEELEFRVSLGYIVRFCPNKQMAIETVRWMEDHDNAGSEDK